MNLVESTLGYNQTMENCKDSAEDSADHQSQLAAESTVSSDLDLEASTTLGARGYFRFSLREVLGMVLIAALGIALGNNSIKLAEQDRELNIMRKAFGYLAPSGDNQVAASRGLSDQPLTYQMRVRLPEPLPEGLEYKVVYSSLWEKGNTSPTWFGSIPIASGESLVTVRVLDDPRDRKWKIAISVSSSAGTYRMSTGLPPPHEEIFRGSHDVISTGINRDTVIASVGESIRLLDDRWVIQGNGVQLDGSAPRENQVGIYAELTPVKL